MWVARGRTPTKEQPLPAHTLTVGIRGLSAVLVVAATVLAPAAPALARDDDHTVRAGETLADIARANGVTVPALAQANGISDPNLIVVGQVLTLPPPTAAAVTAPVVHRVAAGETLSDIARRYGTTVQSLTAANGIADPNRVGVGQSLTIPTGGSGAATAVAAPRTHTVTAGETLGAIAGRYGVSVGAIVDANDLANPSLVRIGQRLTIPPSTSGSGSGAGRTSGYAETGGADGQTGVAGTHTVAWGESLQVIGARYDVTVADLAAANGILPPYRLYAGMRLFLSAPNRLPTDIDWCPVDRASFANDWGLPRPDGRAHAGNDLLAKAGTAVRAPVAGMVSYLTGSRGGHQFWLRGDDGTRYIGAHLEEGGESGRVDAGDVIGHVGTTGNEVAEPHLHFEIQPSGGAAMNPYPVLRAACA